MHRVAVVQMANDECPTSNIDAGTCSAVCRSFCPTSKDASNVALASTLVSNIRRNVWQHANMGYNMHPTFTLTQD